MLHYFACISCAFSQKCRVNKMTKTKKKWVWVTHFTQESAGGITSLSAGGAPTVLAPRVYGTAIIVAVKHF